MPDHGTFRVENGKSDSKIYQRKDLESVLSNEKLVPEEMEMLRKLQLPEFEPSPRAQAEEEKVYLTEDHKRAHRLKEVVSWVVNLGLSMLALIFFTMLALRAWDIVAPIHLRWLTSAQREQIDSLTLIVVSGAVATFASSYFKKIFGFHDGKEEY
ncbi:MAG: hypothetical protein AAGN35_00625 [Bacteroidota bacterium]